MNDQQLDQVAKMLCAQLKGQGHIWWISGYVYGQTSRDDLYILLYPADERLSEKVVRVYPHDFKKLPAFILTEGVDGGDTDANPNKDQARKKGIYHECPLFEIVTFDGRDTQMGKERRFGDVLRVTSHEPRAASEQPGRPAPSAPSPPSASRQPSAPAMVAEPTATRPTLPDYRALALNAKTAEEFDYAAHMALKNSLYTEVERITRTRNSLIPEWSPGPRPNQAMLTALETYRNERAAAQERGESIREAHKLARTAGLNAYHRRLKATDEATASAEQDSLFGQREVARGNGAYEES